VDPVRLAAIIEPTLYRSWKAREMHEYDGWQLRFADGFARRCNSVYPAGQSTLPILEKLQVCRRWYAQRGLDLLVRQTPASEDGLDEVLAASGFTLECPTDVMVGSVGKGGGELEVTPVPTREWWATTARLWGFDLSSGGGWTGIINRIELPAGFVCIDGEAAGLAIVDGEWMGLFEVIVAPGARRRGLGSIVTDSLLTWGRGIGAQRAYLQVVAENTPAIKMYSRLGFEHAYSYWYRRDRRPIP